MHLLLPRGLEPINRPRPALRIRQDLVAIPRQLLQEGCEILVHSDDEPLTRLALPHANKAIVDFAPAHGQDVAETLPGVERQRGRLPQMLPRLAAEMLDLRPAPRHVPVPKLQHLDLRAWVMAAPSPRDRPRHHC